MGPIRSELTTAEAEALLQSGEWSDDALALALVTLVAPKSAWIGRGLSRQQADDVLQSATVSMFFSLSGRPRVVQRPRAYVAAVLDRCRSDLLSQERPRISGVLDEIQYVLSSLDALHYDVADGGLGTDELAQVRAIVREIEQLGHTEATALLGVLVYRLPVALIAEGLGKHRSAVDRAYAAGLKKLRRKLA
ncbi:hypothetical protein [Aquipuribacter sp. MA13-6]|uniref:hypothetical protein n=1 Tax=unclassified Aquipuribacter TaxID=2635084 RepID=UPI003EEB8638